MLSTELYLRSRPVHKCAFAALHMSAMLRHDVWSAAGPEAGQAEGEAEAAKQDTKEHRQNLEEREKISQLMDSQCNAAILLLQLRY